MNAYGVLPAHDAHPTGWRRYLYATNHKDIGTLYLAFATTAGVIGGLLSIAMRLSLKCCPRSNDGWVVRSLARRRPHGR